MSFALATLYFAKDSAHALPAVMTDQSSGPSFDHSIRTRTVWNIIQSCLVTITLSTWVAIHPNIPDSKDGAVRFAFRRAKLVGLALLAPEFVVVWAIRQHLVARKSKVRQGTRSYYQIAC